MDGVNGVNNIEMDVVCKVLIYTDHLEASKACWTRAKMSLGSQIQVQLPKFNFFSTSLKWIKRRLCHTYCHSNSILMCVNITISITSLRCKKINTKLFSQHPSQIVDDLKS